MRRKERPVVGVAVFPADSIDGMRVVYLGWAGGYEWCRALEDREEMPAGTEFVWAMANVRPQLELFS